MAIRLDDGSNDTEVQMAPLIDCVFLLIIFFLVATTMKKIDKELPVQLPDSGAAIEVSREDSLVIIGLDRAGGVYWGAEPVSHEVLHHKLREVANINKNQRIRIDGDRQTPFQSLVYVLDLCQFEGLNHVGIHTSADRSGARRNKEK